ncbi:MAG: hypothetical protein ACRECH_10190 [Nitrososphaerales archaeon]
MMSSISGTGWPYIGLGAFTGVTADDTVSCGSALTELVGGIAFTTATIVTGGTALIIIGGLLVAGVGLVGLPYAC